MWVAGDRGCIGVCMLDVCTCVYPVCMCVCVCGRKSERVCVCVSELNEWGSMDTEKLADIDNEPIQACVFLEWVIQQNKCVCVCVRVCGLQCGVVSCGAESVIAASAAILIRSGGLLCRSVVGRKCN